MRHDTFAERVEKRLRGVADRLDGDARQLGVDGRAARITARAGELRVAAFLVREEAAAVSRSEQVPADADRLSEAPPLRAQA